MKNYYPLSLYIDAIGKQVSTNAFNTKINTQKEENLSSNTIIFTARKLQTKGNRLRLQKYLNIGRFLQKKAKNKFILISFSLVIYVICFLNL